MSDLVGVLLAVSMVSLKLLSLCELNYIEVVFDYTRKAFKMSSLSNYELKCLRLQEKCHIPIDL